MSKADFNQSLQFAEGQRDTQAHNSFVADLLHGVFTPERMVPWPVSDPEAAKLIERIKAELFPIVNVQEIERAHRVPDYVIQKMAELGLFALKVPKQYGGHDFSQRGYIDILVTLACVSSALPALVSASNSLGANFPVTHFGTEEQKQRLLPEIVKGPSGFCFTEQNVGSDPARMEALAVRVYDAQGNHIGYRVRGEKWYTTNAISGRYLSVVARTVVGEYQVSLYPTLPISIFIVPTSSEGIEIGPPNDFAGMHGIDNANPKFRDVFVPVENRIGEEGDGFKIALQALNSGRIAVGAISAAAAGLALAYARRHAGERKQWGKPVGEHE